MLLPRVKLPKVTDLEFPTLAEATEPDPVSARVSPETKLLKVVKFELETVVVAS